MNAVIQRHDIIITGADDDACVRCHFSVQTDKMTPINVTTARLITVAKAMMRRL